MGASDSDQDGVKGAEPQAPPPMLEKAIHDGDDILESLGYTPELQRNRSTLQVAFMAFVLASIPYGLSTTLSNPITTGGPVNIIWGWVAVSALIICVAASLGEITSVYPTAGGVYYQTFMLAPARWRREAGWICGWLFVVGNISITLSVTIGTSTFLVSCINVFEREPGVGVLSGEPYQVFLLFVGVTLLSNAISALGNKWLPWLDTAAIFWTFAGVIALVISILVVAKEGRHDAKWVFTHFENNSGWTDGWAFCVGLLHAAYATSSTGMIISMCEEVRRPDVQVPKAMVATVLINTFAGLLFLIPIVFVLPDLKFLADLASAQPVPPTIKLAVGSSAGAFGLLIPLIVLGIICGIGCITASSRCVWAFARDGAMPGAKWWTKVNRRLDVPFNAMMLSMVIHLLLGLIYFGSTAAFNAFSGVGVLTLNASYATPVAINLLTKRKQVKSAKFSLGAFGYVANAVAVGWSVLAIPLFCMPLRLPVTVRPSLKANARTGLHTRPPPLLFEEPAKVVALASEQKIDSIDRRLEGVTQILHDLKACLPASPRSKSASSFSTTHVLDATVKTSSSTPFGDTSQTVAESLLVEGESSFAAHSAFAHNFLQKAIYGDSLQDVSLDMKETLNALHCMINGLKRQTAKTEMSYAFAKPTFRHSFGGSKLPPIEKVVALIRSAKANQFEVSALIYDLFPMHYFPDICLRIYFSQDFSESDFIIANSGLLELFLEHSQHSSGDRAESLEYAHLCRQNLETALINLPLHLPATPSMIVALLLGACYTIEISKPSLGWTLSSKASELCQTLGYHQIAPGKKGAVANDMKNKQLLFWFTYFIDKSLSLRLGRASTIPNWDITTPMLPIDATYSPIGAAVAVWINTARCQGKIYDSLYSPESVAQPDHIRQSRVQALANELHEIELQAQDIRDHHLQQARDMFGNRIIEHMTLSDDVLRLSLLTLVHRASPIPLGSQSAFVPDCIEAARATLQRHQAFLATFEDLTSTYFATYMHWTLLFAPFTPFIVLFCHIIESKSEADLNRLHAFATSIESAPPLSDAASKMRHLFQVLYNVALHYVECISVPSGGQAQANDNFALNANLTALGFPPINHEDGGQQDVTWVPAQDQSASLQHALDGDATALEGLDGQGGTHPTMWIGHTMELEEWFKGNHNMMGLLEEPTFSFP
ncbi:hypothetical protein ACJZ2D_000901 [Fusarium nematophilum]